MFRADEPELLPAVVELVAAAGDEMLEAARRRMNG